MQNILFLCKNIKGTILYKMRCLNKLNLIYYDHVMMCNNNNITLSRFEMFLIKTLFF